jgi:hypothetical protein
MATFPKSPSLNRHFVNMFMTDTGTAGGASGSVFFTPGFRGKIKKISTVLPAAIVTADAVLTTSIGTAAVTGGAVTITQASSAAGDIDSATPTAANSFSATDYIKTVSDGGPSTVVPVIITYELEAT